MRLMTIPLEPTTGYFPMVNVEMKLEFGDNSILIRVKMRSLAAGMVNALILGSDATISTTAKTSQMKRTAPLSYFLINMTQQRHHR